LLRDLNGVMRFHADPGLIQRCNWIFLYPVHKVHRSYHLLHPGLFQTRNSEHKGHGQLVWENARYLQYSHSNGREKIQFRSQPWFQNRVFLNYLQIF
jgi:hypothetical protein